MYGVTQVVNNDGDEPVENTIHRLKEVMKATMNVRSPSQKFDEFMTIFVS